MAHYLTIDFEIRVIWFLAIFTDTLGNMIKDGGQCWYNSGHKYVVWERALIYALIQTGNQRKWGEKIEEEEGELISGHKVQRLFSKAR